MTLGAWKRRLWSVAAVCLLASALTQAAGAPAAAYLSKMEDQARATCRYENQTGQITIGARPCEQTIEYGPDLTRLPFALVLDGGWQAYGPAGEHLFEVFWFDNGPDEPTEGLIRIVQAGLLGYADVETGAIVVVPRYQCAKPFQNGLAEVGLRCHKAYEPGGEHWWWVADEWLAISR